MHLGEERNNTILTLQLRYTGHILMIDSNEIVDAICSLFDSHHDLICFLILISPHHPMQLLYSYYGTFSPILLIHPSESYSPVTAQTHLSQNIPIYVGIGTFPKGRLFSLIRSIFVRPISSYN